jgi:hypothetical protein
MVRTSGGVARLLALLSTFAFLGSFCACDLPTDHELTVRFNQRRSEFEEIKQMIQDDDLEGRVHADYADPKLTPVRLEQYRMLMKDTGVIRLWAHGMKEPFELIAGGSGFLEQGDCKGYMFNPEKPQPFLQSLDHSCFDSSQIPGTERSCRAASTLDDAWWLIRYEYR